LATVTCLGGGGAFFVDAAAAFLVGDGLRLGDRLGLGDRLSVTATEGDPVSDPDPTGAEDN
jgi:hypothetical protein